MVVVEEAPMQLEEGGEVRASGSLVAFISSISHNQIVEEGEVVARTSLVALINRALRSSTTISDRCRRCLKCP